MPGRVGALLNHEDLLGAGVGDCNHSSTKGEGVLYLPRDWEGNLLALGLRSDLSGIRGKSGGVIGLVEGPGLEANSGLR